MATESRAGGLAIARDGVERYCELLVSPSARVLEGASALLESAIAELALWREKGGVAEEKDRSDLRSIRQLSARARILLGRAAAYHRGWSAYLGSRMGGYQAGGEAAPVARPRRLLAEG